MPGLADLKEKLTFLDDQGRIYLDDYRMAMFSVRALGALRKELYETLGEDHARGLLKRFGYASGMADAVALNERFPCDNLFDQISLGPLLHALEGHAFLQIIEERTEADLEQGIFHVEAYWEGSYEAEQHLELFGPSQYPICWTLCGYAQGHSTVVLGKPTIVVEKACMAMGHDRCRFVVDFAENCHEPKHQSDFNTTHFPKALAELRATIDDQQQKLERTIQQINASTAPEGILGSSEAMTRIYHSARLVAGVDSTVLVRGESGTGKELIARAVHNMSTRSKALFFPVNCSVLPENMQEAELFGFARGAFTGAATARAGIFEAAHGGTLFLDEIGDLNTAAQTKILRVLQEGEVRRLGENRIRKVDVRIIAATHRNLEEMVECGQFREDLFYRLEVFTLTLPPLRQRDNDALLLADFFVSGFARKFNRPVRGLSPGARSLIASYSWPGNVRELEHAMERAVILAAGDMIEPRDLPEKISRSTAPDLPVSPTRPTEEPQDDTGQDCIRDALRRAGGNKARAARLLGISRTTLWRKLKNVNW